MSEIDFPQPVEVPAEFAALGYSGMFNIAVECETDAAALELALKAPFLASIPGWLVLRVDLDQGVAIMVRHDIAAVGDLMGAHVRRVRGVDGSTGE